MPALKFKKGPVANQVGRAEDLVKMVEYVGWEYRYNAMMYIIYPPGEAVTESTNAAAKSAKTRTRKEPVSMALTSGDQRALENAKARLRRVGLFDAVEAKRAAEEQLTRRRTEDARVHSEKIIGSLSLVADDSSEGEPMARQALTTLVDRCVDAGWSARAVGTAKANYLITPPDGRRPITINMDNTSRDYPGIVLTQLTRAGLPEAAGTDPAADDVQEGVGPVPGGWTAVENVDISGWSWAKTPIGKVTKQVVELLLEDGNVVYACVEGDSAGRTWQAVAKHRQAAHPELQSATAKRRAAKKAAAEQAAAEQAAAEQAAGAAGTGGVVQPLFQPPALDAAPMTPADRLAMLLGNGRTTTPRTATTARTAAPAPARQPAVQFCAAVPHPGGQAELLPAPAVPVAAAAEPEVTLRRHDTPPPVARVQMADVAASVRPATPGRPSAGGVPLTEMVARLQHLSQVSAEVEQLREENKKLTEENARLAAKLHGGRDEVDKLRRQGAALAEQCIAKDSTIRRLRAQVEQDQEKVAAAEQLQQVMSTLLGDIAA